jgi:tetratricopeptide (TPR) repeat protein
MKRTKKLIFSLITIAFALLIITGFEYSLRYFQPSLIPAFLNEVNYDQIEWYQINRSYLKTYFPAQEALVPDFKPSLLRKQKTSSTFRILCIGESSMFGVPYQMTANIPGLLRAQLRHLYPNKEIEVVNLGASAINTNVILHLTPVFLRLQPDLVLIYTGHNEFYGPDGIGASWIEKKIPSVTQWKYDLRNLALVRFIETFTASTSRNTPFDANMMKQVSKNTSVELGSDDAELVFANFNRNLKNIIALYHEQHVPVIVSDVTSNISFSPFAYDSSSQNVFTRAGVLLTEKRFEEALSLLQKDKDQRTPNAFTEFLLGKTHAGLHQYDLARSHFWASRDNDLLKFRAPKRINTIIESVCRDASVPFFSSDSIFEARSENGIPDTSLFWEHLHPKAYGYFLIANGFLDKIQEQKILPVSSMQRLPFNFDSLSVSWLDLGFADVTIKNLTSKWPFRNFYVDRDFYPNADQALKNVVDDVYGGRKVWDEACYETAKLFWGKGDIHRAMTTYRAVIEEYPYNFYAHYLLANSLSQTGKLDDAIKHYSVSIRSNPAYPYPKVDLALIRINRAEFDEAIRLLYDALPMAQKEQSLPLQATIHYGLSTAFANKRDYQRALALVDQALLLQPTYQDAIVLKQKIKSMM